MRIEHLTLKNWRNFKSVETAVGNRLFMVGPNASGKSNLLDALRFLRDIAAVGGGLQHAAAVRGGLERVRCLAARNYNRGRVGIKIEMQAADDGPSWVYELHFTAEPRGRRRPSVRRETVSKDEFLEEVRYLHLVPQIIRDPELGQGRRDDPFGGDFLVRLAGTANRARGSRLTRINNALRIAVPQLDALSLERDEAGKPHLAARYKHWRHSGAKQSEHDLSDGTLRLIGLLWMIQEKSRNKKGCVILLEEPEQSLHTAVVRWLPTILHRAARGNRSQFILSTHSTEMLEDPGLGLDEVLILKPGEDGTTALPATEFPDIGTLLDAGLSLAEILHPETAPVGIDRLSTF